MKRKEEEREEKLERYLAKSVAHHTLDWYIQTDPCGFNRTREPRKAAAQILILVKEYNAEMTDGKVFLNYDKKALSKFGGWKAYESFSMVKYRILRPLLEHVGDPDMLLIDADKAIKRRHPDLPIDNVLDYLKEK